MKISNIAHFISLMSTIFSTVAFSSVPVFTLTSPSFQAGALIPSKYACDGENAPIPLRWSGAPAGVKSFALIMDDPDAPEGTWVHWVVFNIPPTLNKWPVSNSSVTSTVVNGQSSWGKTGYGGPCPPSGQHRYFFTLYALDANLSLSSSANASDLRIAVEPHVLGKAQLMGVYQKINQ